MATGSKRERRPGVWELRAHLGRGPDGKRRDVSRTFHGGSRAAQRALRELLDEVDDMRAALAVEAGPGVGERYIETVGHLLEEWQAHKARSWSPKTAYDHRRTIESVLLDPDRGNLRDVELVTLRTIDVDRLYRRLVDAGVTASMLAKAHRILRAALGQAVTWEVIARNPASGAELPVQHSPAKHGTTLAAIRSVLEVDDVHMRTLVRVAAATGQRRASLCGLQWRDIDPDRRVITFARRVLVVDGAAHVLPGSKTGKVVTTPVDPGTLEVLDAYRQHRQVEAMKSGVGRIAPDTFVFARTPDGALHWNPDTMSDRWRALADRHGLKGVCLHDLRRLMVSLLIAEGFDPETVRDRAGHSKTSTTLDFYAHVLDDRARAAGDRIGDLLDGTA